MENAKDMNIPDGGFYDGNTPFWRMLGRNITLTCIAAADWCERQQPRPLPKKNCLVCLPVLLVHNDVDDGVDTGGQVQHNVAQNMETCKHASTTVQP
jgi:hypothetical protein